MLDLLRKLQRVAWRDIIRIEEGLTAGHGSKVTYIQGISGNRSIFLQEYSDLLLQCPCTCQREQR